MDDALSETIAGFVVDVDRVLERATALLEAGRNADAAKLLEAHSAAHAGNSRLHVNLGIAYLRLSRPEDALKSFEEAARLDPDAYMVHVNLAASHLQLGHAEAALRSARRTLELAPSYASAHLLAARAEALLGDLGAAERALLEAERLDPLSPAIQQTLADLRIVQDRDRDALPHLRAACASLPDRWQPQAQLAQVALRLGELDEARRAVNLGLALAPGEPVLIAMQAELDALGVR
jgi:tetratricopeptide (TPR) repeat protein